MYKKMLGDTIYRLRKEKGLSQAELGALLNVDSKAVKKWELYVECPGITLLPVLVELLNDAEGNLFLYYYDFVGVA